MQRVRTRAFSGSIVYSPAQPSRAWLSMTDLLGQPDGHRTAPRAHFETPPARPHHRPSPPRHRIEDLLQQGKPFLLGQHTPCP